MAAGGYETDRLSRHDRDHRHKSSPPADRYRPELRSRFAETFQMSAVTGVILRTALHDTADVLHQVKGRHLRFCLAKTCSQGLAHDLRLRHPPLTCKGAKVGADFVRDLTGDGGHRFADNTKMHMKQYRRRAVTPFMN